MAKRVKIDLQQAMEVGEGPSATTRPMKRNMEQWPAPHTANVHVDEVDNWKKHGWEHAD